MSAMISDAVKAVAGPVKTLVVDRIQEYVKLITSYEENKTNLVNELKKLSAKKLDLDAKVKKEKANMQVMKRETGNWLRSLMNLIERQEMRQLMREEGVAEIVVKMMERRVLKKLWKEDREIFDIVVDVVKNKCNHPRVGDEEVVDPEEDADYQKVAKIASDVVKDIAEEFTKFIKGDDAAVAVVQLLNNVDLNTVDLEKLRNDGDEMAMILIKGEGIIRKEVGNNHDNEEELLIPKHDEDVKPVNESFIKEKVTSLRKRMGRLMTFLDDANFKKSLPDSARLGLEVMTALSNSSGSEQAVENNKPHRYCGYCIVRFEVNRRHHDMSERAVTMVEAIKSLIQEFPSDPVTRSITDDELEYIPGEFLGGLESREALLRKILIALKDDQVNVVGVYGMGGCVAHQRTSDLFDKRVVVEVSETPNIKGIQNQIGAGIGLILEDVNTTAQRAQKLYNRLKSEKILIILDNVWKKLKLDEIGIPREKTKDFCCTLLITTREVQVCKLMDVQERNTFKVGLLNEREALNLFENQTEKKADNTEFKPVVDRLLRKCGGLPLAIAATASALRGKDLSMWYHFAETSEKPISSQVSREYRETYSILETSYKLVDITEKMILLYLVCLSPLDSAITVDDLMRYGIGLDLFQHVNGLSEAMEQATTWATELISSSLLLKGDSDGEVKIHDLVRASSISFIDKGEDRRTIVESVPRWMCEETFEKMTAISLMSGHDFSRLSGVKAPLLEILLLKGDVSLTTLPSTFFEGMKNLKVLSLSNMNFNLGLPESMGQLHRLKTLHLHYCELDDVKLIGKLVNLLVLSLRGSTLKELAVETGELHKLRLLDIEGCKGMKSIPANILSRLSYLEGLYMLNSFDGWASTNIEVNSGGESNQASGSELDMLSHLNVLEMEVSKTQQLLTVNSVQLIEQLGKFKIRVRSSYGSHEKLPSFRYVLELIDIDPSPNNGLRALLKKTECLVLSDCKRLTKNVVPELNEDGFKDLKYLKVQTCWVESIMSSNEENELMAFSNLEILEILDMNNIKMICDGKASLGIFSNLQRLKLFNLPELESGLSLTSALVNLNEVSVEFCSSLKCVAYKDAKNETEVDMFPRLKSLHLLWIESLFSLLGQSGNESKYPSLENLNLFCNDTIQTLWISACHVSGFQNLKSLHIQGCTELRSLGSPSIFAALVQLEQLKIISCDKLQEVISRETEGGKVLEKAINFPKLKYLSLENSKEIESFYRGSYNLKFPHLKSLRLSTILHFANFDGPGNSATLFSDKLEFPCLEELDVREVSNNVLRLWNWSSSLMQGERENGSISLNPVPNLQILRLGKVDGFVTIPHSVSHKLSHLEVNDFDNIKFLFSVSTGNGEIFCTYSQLPYLKNLSVSRCKSLEQLFDGEDDDVVVSFCERLIEITLETDLFTKGKEQLQLLESLEIEYCRNMEVIIKDEVVGEGEESVYSFPRLKILKLTALPITKFASKPNTQIQFPSLESIELDSCYEIKSFWSGSFIAPKLKGVKVSECDDIQCFFSEKRNEVWKLSLLERVEIDSCSSLLSFSSEPVDAPKLEDVTLNSCSKMKWFIRGDQNNNDIVELPSLEIVYITDCHDMKTFSPGGTNAPKLCKLEIDEEDYSKRANKELQFMLANLPNYYKREEWEEEGGQSAGEMEELQNDGTQDESNNDEDEELEELRTEQWWKRRAQQQNHPAASNVPKNSEETEFLEDGDVGDVSDGQLCVILICLTRRQRAAFVPCGQLVYCQRCALSVERDLAPKCPVC
ncbi:hypothetical protein KSS87_023911 [Heliosperma pusillum]|nr:hypothetical protein KSS87_023911 [Heliosperma pusillum]